MPRRFTHHEMIGEDIGKYGHRVTHPATGLQDEGDAYKNRPRNRQLAVIRLMYKLIDYERARADELQERVWRLEREADDAV